MTADQHRRPGRYGVAVQMTLDVAQQAVEPGRADRRARWVWLTALVAFFLMGAGWALALPANGTYDEKEHIPRAYGVADGQLYAKGYTVEAPASLLPHRIDCTWGDKGRPPASCQRPAPAAGTPAGDRIVQWPSQAARYSPVYYLPVGIPLVLSPDMTGIIGARLVSSLLSALLLASAVVVAYRLRSWLLFAGVVLAATPMTMNLSGAVNPNGLEIAAGVLAWATLLALVRAPDGALDERGLRRTTVLWGISAALLMTVRHMGPVMLAIIVVAGLVLARPGRVRALLRRRAVWLSIAGVGLATAFAGWWAVTSSVDNVPAIPGRAAHLSALEILRQIADTRISFYASQVIGKFEYGQTKLPLWMYAVWYGLVVVLVVAGLARGGRRYRLVWAGVGVLCLGILVGLELWFVPRLGWYAHGRYVMPLGAGLVLLPAFADRYPAALRPERVRLFARVVVVAAAVVQWGALQGVLWRFVHGVAPTPARWSPQYGTLAPMVAEAVGVVLLAGLAWGLVRRPAADRTVAASGDADTVAGSDGVAAGTSPTRQSAQPGGNSTAPRTQANVSRSSGSQQAPVAD